MPSIYDVLLFVAGAVCFLLAWRKAGDVKIGKTKRRYVKKARTWNVTIPLKKPRRKRRTKAEMAAARADMADKVDTFLKPLEPAGPPVIKRKRGRPRKADSIPAPVVGDKADQVPVN